MRWFLGIYTILCMVLTMFGYIYFYGLLFDGLPLGTYVGHRDVSGMHFQPLFELHERKFTRWSAKVFVVKTPEREHRLELDKGWFLRLDRKRMVDAYMAMVNEVGLWERVTSYLRLDYGFREFQFEPELDVYRTRQSLQRFIGNEAEIERLLAEIAKYVKENPVSEVVLFTNSG